MLVHGTCITFGIILVGGITYGIFLSVKPYFHKADFVNPFAPINNESSYLVFRNHSYTEMFQNISSKNETSSFSENITASGYPHIPGLKKDTLPQCQDPTFACQDLESARLCNVVKTCIHDIWSTLTVPNDNDEVCDICKEMVKEARDQLLSNMTQEEIKEVFEGSCKLLPIKLVADACIKVVDEIIPELVEMLASRMDPTMVCTVSGMCFATHTTKENHVLKFFKIILAKDQASKCDQCTALVQDAQAFMQSSSEAEVKTYMEQFCDEKMPKYLDAVQVCSSVGICPKKCTFEDTRVTDELTCEFCEHVLQHVKDLITANTTAEEFKTALLNFCKHVGSFSDRCTSLVNDYYDMLFDYIRKLDTKGMCTLMGLCDNQACLNLKPMVEMIPAIQTLKRVPMMKLVPAQRIQIEKNQPIPLVNLIPATVLSKKDMKESNDIFRKL